MDTRRFTLLIAIVSVVVSGLGAVAFGAFFLAVAVGVVPLLAGGVHAFVWVLAIIAIVFGVAGLVAAGGLWRGRPWAWTVAAATQLAAVMGAAIAVATSGPQLPTLLGSILVVTGLTALLASDSRRAAHV